MPKVTFKYADEACVYPRLVNAVNILCAAKGKDCTCTSGYRSLEKQKSINADSLRTRKDQGAYQLANGAVYTPDGKCWAAAFGKSNHCFCIAIDITDEWFQALGNAELAKYGLIKPISYEPWHVQLVEHMGISEEEKKAIRDMYLKGGNKGMTIKEFQQITGLKDDGIVGDKTRAKAKEVLVVCQKILGNDFKTVEDLIKATQNNPDMWLAKQKEIKYFSDFIINIAKRIGGMQE